MMGLKAAGAVLKARQLREPGSRGDPVPLLEASVPIDFVSREIPPPTEAGTGIRGERKPKFT